MLSPRWLAPVVVLTLLACASSQDQVIASRLEAMRATRELADAEMREAKLELQLAGGGKSWCPNQTFWAQLRAIVHAKSGDFYTPVQLRTEPPGFLPRSLVELSVSARGVTLSPEWVLEPSLTLSLQDLLSLASRPLIVTGRLQKANATSTLSIENSFDCDQSMEFPGRDGRPGVSGEDGEAGLDVVVSLAYVGVGEKKLILAKGTPSMGQPSYVLVAPGRRITLDLHGGSGGNGGEGVAWGVRVIGAAGGDGGNGGRLIVQFDPTATELRSVVKLVNPGGRPGGIGSGRGISDVVPGRPGLTGPAAKYQPATPEAMFADEIQAGVPVMGGSSKSQI